MCTSPTGLPGVAPAGTRYSCDRDRKVNRRDGQDPCRHGAGNLLADRTAGVQHGARNTQQLLLGVVGINHESPVQDS